VTRVGTEDRNGDNEGAPLTLPSVAGGRRARYSSFSSSWAAASALALMCSMRWSGVSRS